MRITQLRHVAAACAAGLALGAAAPVLSASAKDDMSTVATLDTRYQTAVKNNDVEAMARILDADFTLVLSDGRVISRAELLAESTAAKVVYERQEEVPGTQTVRVWGDTAVVTALLWIKGHQGEQSFDRHLWFSDTYVRTRDGWRYAFGQASCALPESKIPHPG
jgi:ketosteroid isomerase-like protein